MFTLPTNAEKQAVWDTYRAHDPLRVPLKWGTNSRVVMLDPALNPEGYTYEGMLHDPQVGLAILPRWQEYATTTLAETDDTLIELPAEWTLWVENQNIYDGAYFGAPFGGRVKFCDGQVPSFEACLTEDDIDAFMATDFFTDPLANPWIQERLAFHAELTAAAQDFSYLGRPGKVVPFNVGFDGPLTVAAVLFGAEIFFYLAAEPEKARELMLFITRAAIARNRALSALAGQADKGAWGWAADDSIQLISTAMYEEIVLPAHALWYDEMSTSTPASKQRSIHLCGDATRHFATLRDRLGIVAFDTGFPVDFGALRATLGPEVEISGGPHVDLLRLGTADECFALTRDILQSGVMTGGRFHLREGNNLPPCVPLENLQAVYAACLEFGWYRPS
jgi:uroporphyrinogen-III decarboxylase